MTRENRELTTVAARRELTKLPEKLGANPATVKSPLIPLYQRGNILDFILALDTESSLKQFLSLDGRGEGEGGGDSVSYLSYRN